MRAIFRVVLLALICGASVIGASAQIAPGCPDRPSPGSPVNNPLDLYSQNGVLTLSLVLQNGVDISGFMHYCYIYVYQGQEVEAPTLRLNPGDTLNINFTNNIQAPYNLLPEEAKAFKAMQKAMKMDMHMTHSPADDCSGNPVMESSTNIHFHGLNVPPVCHQDDILNTVIESGDPVFQYSLQIPTNEPPGMYWYHPHVHGLATTQVTGGASGALIVEGPIPQGLNERVLILREQDKTGPANDPDSNAQLTVNFQPAVYPEGGLAPAITVQPGAQEYWRFLNSTARQFTSLQLMYGLTQQTFEVVSIDGVQLTTPMYTQTLNIPPAGRMEFIIPGLPSGQVGTFQTNGYDTGTVGDLNGPQVLAKLTTSTNSQPQRSTVLAKTVQVKPPTQPVRFANLSQLQPTITRQLYFAEQNVSTNGGTQFYITVAGQQPHLFHMDDPPAIVTQVGNVEDWTITNKSGEVHAFHIHQIHFLVEAIDGVPVTNPDMQDTVIVAPWTGVGPYHTVTLRMDFRDPNIAGTFVYHCHILDHEDGGMMAKIQVNPAN